MRLIELTGYRPSQDVGLIDSIDYFNEPQRINRWDRLTATEIAWLETEIEKCRDSFSYLARNYFRIVTKTKKEKYFEFWPGQELILQAMQELMDSGKAPKLLILKARQLGALDPDTNVLTADLRWVRIEDLCVGDEVVAFDEEKPSGYGNSRKMRNATVLKKWEVEKEAFEITLEDGRTIIATGDHPFLSKRFVSSTDTAWRRVRDDSPHQKFLSEIRVGDVIRSIVDVWLSPKQKTRKQLWDDAWFGGLLDGEGSLRTKTRGGIEICVSQVDGDVLDRAKAYLDSNYYRYRIEADTRKAGESSKLGNKIVYKLVINQTKEIFRLLGETRPTRFMSRYPWIGKEFPNGDSWIKVTAIRSLGPRRMVDIQTSTQTFVAEGLCTHNCSTLVEAIMAWLTIFYTNSNCLVVSYDIPHTAYLFSLMQGFFDFLPWWMKPRTSARERKAGMQFNNPDPDMRSLDPGLNSFIMAEPANAVTGTGRGFRFNGFHGSEVGLWKERAQEIIEAQVKNALVDDATTMGILEGTPDGVGTYFNKFWNQMVELGDRAAWRPKYFPFFMEPTRVLAPPSGWRLAEYEERVRDVVKLEWVRCSSPQCGHINERIRLGVDMAGSVCVRCNAAMYAPLILSDGQLCWYEDARINASTKPETLKLFKQEMSVTANQAWQMSGSPIFSDAAIEWVDFNVRTPRIVGFFDRLDNFHGVNWETGRCILKSCEADHRFDATDVHIWEQPDRNSTYYIGADPSMGLGQDYHCAVVIRLGPGSSADRQVASFRNNKMDPIKFAYVLKSLGKFYNEAEIAIEVDKVDSVAHHLINALSYPRVYQRQNGDTTGYVGKFGWRTSPKSKRNLISHAMLWLNGKSAIVRSQNLGNEIKTLQRDPENPDKIEAAQGSHDDEVMAWMIALWCAREHQVDDRLGYIPLQEEITLDNAPYKMICSKCGETSPVVDPKQTRRCLNKACGSIWVSYKSNTAPLSPLSELEKELFGTVEGESVQTYASYLS